MKKIEKPGHFKEKELNNPGEELAYLLWQAELNKELLAFWKALTK